MPVQTASGSNLTLTTDFLFCMGFPFHPAKSNSLKGVDGKCKPELNSQHDVKVSQSINQSG